MCLIYLEQYLHPKYNYLRSGMSSDEALQFQSFSLLDDVNPLAILLFLHITGLTCMHNSHCRGRCKQEHKWKNTC